jgi:hypothetical protein
MGANFDRSGWALVITDMDKMQMRINNDLIVFIFIDLDIK